MARGVALTDEQKQQILDLHAAGAGRNEIMRRLGLSAHAVTRTVQDAGLSFERVDMSAAATEARRQDLKARRAALMSGLLEDAALLRTQLFSPMIAFNFGGRENTYAEVEIPEPTPRDKQALMQAIGTALNTVARLEGMDKANSIDNAKSMLGDLASALGLAYEQLQAAEAEASDADRS